MGKNWFSSFWEKMIAFWKKNLDDNYKQVSVGFGVLLVVILTALIPPVSAVFNGETADWGTFGITSFIALVVFLTLLVYSFFGKGENVVAPEPSS